MSTYSIEMPFEPIPSFHLNLIEKFEYEKPVEEVVHVHTVCKVDAPLCLNELFKDDLVAHTPSLEYIDKKYEDECDDDELLFLDELLKNECDHNDEKTCAKNLKSRVPFKKRKLDLSIFLFDEPTNDQAFENMIQKPLIDRSLENLFEDELICLNESIRYALVSYTPPKKIAYPSFEVMFKDELKFLDNHIVDTPIVLCDNDEFLKSRSGKKCTRRLRKMQNKLERIRLR